ncbi:MAG: hypothetical protein JXA37_04585 [Chloroflexia bacterium]|nr:hypothetical protein [Chloroflexia bacterium]
MEFAVGDKVVHPRIGAGRITGTKEQELVAGFASYYVIEIPGKESTLYIPRNKIEELGVRPVMSPKKLEEVLAVLSSPAEQLYDDARERQKDVQERLSSGDPVQIAEVLRDLCWHRHKSSLTKKDEELVAQGNEFLAAEMALAVGTTVPEVQGRINEALERLVAQDDDES